jgi:membrane protein
LKPSEKYLKLFLDWEPVARIIRLSKKIILPGFDGLPLYNVARFFIEGLQKGALTMRAASMSFSFFLAFFPGILFFFTLIPYVPIEDFHQKLMELLMQLLPASAFDTIWTTVEDILNRPRGGLLSLGFVLAMYFSTNGVSSMIEAFNQTHHALETRSWIKQRLIAILLVVITSVIVILAIALLTAGNAAIDYLVEKDLLRGSLNIFFVQLSKWVVILGMVFFVISFSYYLAPARSSHFRFISAGSSLSTLLSLLTMVGFNFYISNFNRYNALYGSIGTLLVLMLWIYFNAIILLIGFELNASISGARKDTGSESQPEQ